jgi:hypothetical protein
MPGQLSALLQQVERDSTASFEPPRGADGPPRLELARSFVRTASAWLEELNNAAGAREELRLIVSGSVLHATFPVLVQYRHGQSARARALLSWLWASHAAAFGMLEPGEVETILPSPAIEPLESSPEDQEYLEVLELAIGEYLRNARAGDGARRSLRELLTTLSISTEDLGRMFQVSGETARRWEQGVVAIPPQQQAVITLAGDALTRLRSFFLPERLPAVIRRRPAPLFEGDSALDWILRGRIREVVDRYDRLLSYEPEQLQQLATNG